MLATSCRQIAKTSLKLIQLFLNLGILHDLFTVTLVTETVKFPLIHMKTSFGKIVAILPKWHRSEHHAHVSSKQ